MLAVLPVLAMLTVLPVLTVLAMLTVLTMLAMLHGRETACRHCAPPGNLPCVMETGISGTILSTGG